MLGLALLFSARPLGAEEVRARTIADGASAGARGPAVAAASSDPAAITRRVALVVGNASYTAVPALKNSRNDAEDMCAALGRLGFETSCLTDLATRADFRRALVQFRQRLGPTTAAVFYFAGHGVQIGGRNFLLPTTIAATSDVAAISSAMPVDEVFAALEERETGLSIVVLDACRDNPFTSARGAKPARGLARDEPPKGSVLVYATAPGATAVDGNGRNGLFTSHLLAEIERPGPQIGEMLRTVARKVEQEARTRYGVEQVPYRSFSYSGVFCFSQCDDTQIAEQLEQLRQQGLAARARIRLLEERNAALEGHRGSATDAPSLREAADRQAELGTLRRQIADLTVRATQLETYRQRIATLEREAREKEEQITRNIRVEQERRARPLGVPTF